MNNSYSSIGSIILAAGKGKRMQAGEKNKVSLLLGQKPIVLRIVHLLTSLQVGAIVVVVGFAKDSVQEALAGEQVIFAEQTDQLGTAHATESGLSKMPGNIEHVIVMYGDDASLYPLSLLQELVEQHQLSQADVTLITFTVANSYGLGRIMRDEEDHIAAIVEEKNATDDQKRINEVNPGCYIFNKAFLSEYLPKIEKNEVSGEYYLTDIVMLALKHDKKVETVQAGNLPWKAMNTPKELEEAEKMFGSM